MKSVALLVAGVLLTLAGVAWLCPPAAVILAGVTLAAAGLFLENGPAE